jgi:hypothetical protein
MWKLSVFLFLQIAFILLLLYANKKYFSKPLGMGKIALFAAIFFYLSIIITVIITNILLKSHLDSFDLNHNGSFDIEEQTAEQAMAMRKVISDTGRTFAPIIGIVYSLIYFVLVLIVLKIFVRAKVEVNGI